MREITSLLDILILRCHLFYSVFDSLAWLLKEFDLWVNILFYHILVLSSWWISLTTCLSLQANNLHHGICHKLCFSFASYWACEFICFCVLEDTGGVRIPCLYTLYSNTIILNCVQILGAPLFSIKTLFCSNHNILCLFG